MSDTHSATSSPIDLERVIRLQADHHFSVPTDTFDTMEDYCLALIHRHAYDEASPYAMNRRVLDLGCNNGYGTVALAQSGASLVVGVDVSRRMLEEARARPGHPRAKFLPVDGIRLPFPDATFDVVTSFQVIEHVADYTVYLSEIRRVLRPGGVVLFTTPNARLRLDPGMTPWNVFHVHEFQGSELRHLLGQWFEDVQVMGLFAVDAIYSVESGRLNRLREKARHDQQRRLPTAWQLRASIIEALKRSLPDIVVERLRAFMRARQVEQIVKQPAGKPASAFPVFASSDLFYRSDEIDRSLDLLGICRRG